VDSICVLTDFLCVFIPNIVCLSAVVYNELQNGIITYPSSIPSASSSSSIALPPAPSWPMIKDSEERVRRNTPTIGQSSFEKIRENGLVFIDKSMLISEFLRDSAEVALILRPRRWGKTIASTMIYEFVRPGADRCLFRGLNIFNDENAMKKLGEFPFILLSLADLCGSTWEVQYSSLVSLIAMLYKAHEPMIFPYIPSVEQTLYNLIITKTAPISEVSQSLRYLSMWYYQLYQRQTIFIIDEYDKSYFSFYDESESYLS